MIKGLTYKLFLGSKDLPSIVIQNLAHYEHALPTKIEIPTIDSYTSRLLTSCARLLSPKAPRNTQTSSCSEHMSFMSEKSVKTPLF